MISSAAAALRHTTIAHARFTNSRSSRRASLRYRHSRGIFYRLLHRYNTLSGHTIAHALLRYLRYTADAIGCRPRSLPPRLLMHVRFLPQRAAYQKPSHTMLFSSGGSRQRLIHCAASRGNCFCRALPSPVASSTIEICCSAHYNDAAPLYLRCIIPASSSARIKFHLRVLFFFCC